MLGDFITRSLMMVVAYAYPAFECYKTVEKNKVEIEQLRFWCQYWIIIATMTVLERFLDTFVSWLPMYGEMKLGFIIYLWYPKTKGTSYVYQVLLRPYIAKYEKDIDRQILELKARALDLVSLHFQSCLIYAQTTFFQILQYLAAQSTRVRHGTPVTPQKGSSQRYSSVNTKEQTDKMQSTSVRRMVSQSPKTELVQEHLQSETQSQNVQCTSTTEDNNTPRTESTNVQESDTTETPHADSTTRAESDMVGTLRAARSRLRRSSEPSTPRTPKTLKTS